MQNYTQLVLICGTFKKACVTECEYGSTYVEKLLNLSNQAIVEAKDECYNHIEGISG